jgi:glycosyltransferase involved in cell wall biosynthesis
MRKKIDILYVTHDSLYEGIGMSQIVPVITGLAKMGWEVGVISCEKRLDDNKLDQELYDLGISWKKLKFGKQGALGGVGRLLRLAISSPNARAYHCRSDLAAAACILRLRRNILWDVRGLWVDQKLVIGNISKNKIVINLSRKLESIAASNAKAVSTLTTRVYPVLKKRHPNITSFHMVIPTCTDLTRFEYNPELPKAKTLLLSGVFNNYYDLDSIRQFISEFRKIEKLRVVWCHGEEAKLSFLGVGEDEVKILTQREMSTEISLSSFGLAICKKEIGESLSGVMPTKIAEFLAVGRPVVVSEGIGDLDEILTSTETGVVYGNSISSTIRDINLLLNDPDISARCRRLAEKHFNIKKAVVSYNQIFTKLINSK